MPISSQYCFVLLTFSFVLIFISAVTFKQPSLLQTFPLISLFHPWCSDSFYQCSTLIMPVFCSYSLCFAIAYEMKFQCCLFKVYVGGPASQLITALSLIISLIIPGTESSLCDPHPRIHLDHHHLTEPCCASDVPCDHNSVDSSCCGQALLSATTLPHCPSNSLP